MIFESLKSMVDLKGIRDHILVHIIQCLDYGKPGKAREFLTHSIENGSNNIKLCCLDLLLQLYRSELNDFLNWAIELLVK